MRKLALASGEPASGELASGELATTEPHAAAHTSKTMLRTMLTIVSGSRCTTGDVASEQQRSGLLRCPVPEASLGGELRRILEGTEQAIPQREHSVVVRVHTACVVQRMALGSVDHVAEPARRRDREVHERADREARVGGHTGRERGDSERDADARAERGVDREIERMTVCRPSDVDALGAVMELVPAPPSAKNTRPLASQPRMRGCGRPGVSRSSAMKDRKVSGNRTLSVAMLA